MLKAPLLLCIEWFRKTPRDENENAWSVNVHEILKYDGGGNLLSCDLALKNPSNVDALEHLPPEDLAADIIAKEKRIIEIMMEIRAELGGLNR